MALFVNEGVTADLFGPGHYTLVTRNLPLLTNLQHWDKAFESPFKSDVYFFSTRLQTNQRWGTQQPLTVRDRDFGAVRVRAFGMYSWHVAHPPTFYARVSGTREEYRVADLEGHLRNLIVSQVTDAFANSGVPFLDMAGNVTALGQTVADRLEQPFTDLGLALDSFVVESLSLPDELQKRLDERIGINMVGDMGQYARFQAAQSMPIAAANEGGGAGLGAGLGAGMAMGKMMTDALHQGSGAGGQGSGGTAPVAGSPTGSPAPDPRPPAGAEQASSTETKFCLHCGKQIARQAKFCPECGGAQG
jgi:membrane protease subunit (stomatin/prohibitin family)